MPDRSTRNRVPRLDQLEAKRLLAASHPAAYVATAEAGTGVAPIAPSASLRPVALADSQSGTAIPPVAQGRRFAALAIRLDRVTNPSVDRKNVELTPPYGHVLVQSRLPVPGRTYNALFISVYNGTGRTFTAADGLSVRTSNSPAGIAYPILTGNQVWPAGGRIVFYVLSESYYKLNPTQSAGFQFNFLNPKHPKATAIPGPSGIALRIKYDPTTLDKILDDDVTSGPGAIGHQFGLPDTAIFQVVPFSTKLEPL